MITGIEELDAALERLGNAPNRDEHHRLLCELAPIASRHIDRISERFDDDLFPRFNITWALIGNCDPCAIALFCRAIRDSDKYVRWAASKALSKCQCDASMAALVDAMKDRSTLVKGEAVSAMKRLKPKAAVDQLRKIVESHHLQTHSPGIVRDAADALEQIQDAERTER